MIEAVIFDMDGTIIDSESYWTLAEQEVFGSLGVKLDEASTQITAALTTEEVAEYWFERCAWEGLSKEEVAQRIVNRVAELIQQDGNSLPGALQAIIFFAKQNIQLALCTNSPTSLINVVLDKLNLHNTFAVHVSAEDEERGKPDAAVYKTALKKLNKGALQCLAIEDTPTGVKSATGAGIQTVAVSAVRNTQEFTNAGAMVHITTLKELNSYFLTHLQKQP
ncbi:MAG: HAD-IA family hydrolase [Salinivirgaceae bacterium]|jgi:HAD superfamily hydrolase (TIGR01509 family)|nr:HAD-IA family hydrolase [Salinivirgaceae bacterium]